VNNWKVIFATVVIFGTGVITGGLLVNYVHNSRPKAVHKPAAEMHAPATNQVVHAPEAAKLRPPEILSRQFLQRLENELHLAPDQQEAVQKIIDDGQNAIRKVIQDSRLEIREVLTPEQQKQFDDLIKRPFRKPLFNTNAPAAGPLATNAAAI
jgi:Spy/CpxP family protein refolding chaperone